MKRKNTRDLPNQPKRVKTTRSSHIPTTIVNPFTRRRVLNHVPNRLRIKNQLKQRCLDLFGPNGDGLRTVKLRDGFHQAIHFDVSETKHRLPISHAQYKVRITKRPYVYSIEQQMSLFETIIDKFRSTLSPKDKMQLYMSFIDRHSFGGRVKTKMRCVEDFNMNEALLAIDALLQSGHDLLQDSDGNFTIENLVFNFIAIKIPLGGGYKNVLDKANIYSKQSIIRIKNKDEICLARGIVTMISRLESIDGNRTQQKKYKNMRQGRNIQTLEAKHLHEATNVPEGFCGPEEAQLFADHLNYNVAVFSVRGKLIFKCHVDAERPWIYLLKQSNHYDGITSMTGFLSKNTGVRLASRGTKDNTMHRGLFNL